MKQLSYAITCIIESLKYLNIQRLSFLRQLNRLTKLMANIMAYYRSFVFYIGILNMLVLLMACASNGVIGVAYNKQGIVKYVFKNSSAEKAGILLEDKILNKTSLRGRVGSMCLVKYERVGVYHEIFVLRQHIDTLEYPDKTWK